MSQRLNLELEPADTERLANLCGHFDQHLKQIEARLQVDIFCRGNLFTVQGESRQARAASRLLKQLYKLSESEMLSPELINLHLQEISVAQFLDQLWDIVGIVLAVGVEGDDDSSSGLVESGLESGGLAYAFSQFDADESGPVRGGLFQEPGGLVRASVVHDQHLVRGAQRVHDGPQFG